MAEKVAHGFSLKPMHDEPHKYYIYYMCVCVSNLVNGIEMYSDYIYTHFYNKKYIHSYIKLIFLAYLTNLVDVDSSVESEPRKRGSYLVPVAKVGAFRVTATYRVIDH